METFMALTTKQRWEIVFFCIHKLGPKLSLAAAAKHVGCSKSTAYHWVETFKTTGDVVDELGRGRKRKTPEKEGEPIVQSSLHDPGRK